MNRRKLFAFFAAAAPAAAMAVAAVAQAEPVIPDNVVRVLPRKCACGSPLFYRRVYQRIIQIGHTREVYADTKHVLVCGWCQTLDPFDEHGLGLNKLRADYFTSPVAAPTVREIYTPVGRHAVLASRRV